MTSDHNGEKCKRGYSKHGLCQLKAAVKTLGNRAIDQRTKVGRALSHWRAELVSDLGGAEHCSTQELALVDLAVKSKLILDSIDGWILRQPSLVNRRNRSLLPVVKERTQIASGFLMTLNALGLKRRRPPALSLGAYLAGNGGGTRGAVEGENTETVTNGGMETTILRRETGFSMPAASEEKEEKVEEGKSAGSVDAHRLTLRQEATGATITPPHGSEAEAGEDRAMASQEAVVEAPLLPEGKASEEPEERQLGENGAPQALLPEGKASEEPEESA